MKSMTAREFNAASKDVRLSPPIRRALVEILVLGSTWACASGENGCTEGGILKAMRRLKAVKLRRDQVKTILTEALPHLPDGIKQRAEKVLEANP